MKKKNEKNQKIKKVIEFIVILIIAFVVSELAANNSKISTAIDYFFYAFIALTFILLIYLYAKGIIPHKIKGKKIKKK